MVINRRKRSPITNSSSDPKVDEVELDNATYYVARSPRHLPQGAPTSPAISDLICRRLDNRIKGADYCLMSVSTGRKGGLY
ncbi:MAG: hypothetical protein MI799_05545 [Desulfobacterales bacterium]|nr:hypothetical protein [Desulfobacterales bacterium]